MIEICRPKNIKVFFERNAWRMRVLKHGERQETPFILHLLPYLTEKMVPAFIWVT